MSPTECSKSTCHEPAEFIVSIEAFTRPTDEPITLVLGLAVCAAHTPTIDEIIDDETWNILDTWALNGRFRLCDRDLTKLSLVPLAGEEGLILQTMLLNKKKKSNG